MSGTYNAAGTIRSHRRYVAVMPCADDPYRTHYMQFVCDAAGRPLLTRAVADISKAYMAESTGDIIVRLRSLPNGVPKEFKTMVSFQGIDIEVPLDNFFTAPMPR